VAATSAGGGYGVFGFCLDIIRSGWLRQE